ncbi:MAG TPA: helix-turn-helix transcriptional regulator [Pilimelia sp.]|nr:helix-turn-helix transcriptional regulator [Pilimelia sp.]
MASAASPPHPATVDPDLARALDEAARAFAVQLGHWRHARGLTKKQLAARMRFDPSYVSHIERCRHRPTADFARRAEAVLLTSGSLWRHFEAYHRLRRCASDQRPAPQPPWLPPTAGLVVEREHATLTHRGDAYQCRVRRELHNAGAEPVHRFPVRVHVDRWPQDPARSRAHHHAHPLTPAAVCLAASLHADGREVALGWESRQDRESLQEAWLLFRSADGPFPLRPGVRATLTYEYTVDERLWGPWFQRSVRLPTGQLSMVLDLPGRPAVWGTATTPATAEAALPVTPDAVGAGGRTRFHWRVDNPPLLARYRLAWHPEPAAVPRPRVRGR